MKTTFALLLVLVMGVAAQANVYTFNPDPIDLWDLTHGEAYTWGINWQAQPDEEITGARLTFSNIHDWIVEDNDSLYIHLMDNAPAGATQLVDFVEGPEDYFAGQGLLIDTWSDPLGGSSSTTLTYDFTADQLAALSSYAGDGLFAFGFDPDCHYWNDGVQFEVTTAVPEPATMVLFGLGLAGAGLRRKMRRNK